MNQTAQDIARRTSVDPAEVERFSALAAEWWNPNGKFAVLRTMHRAYGDYISYDCVRPRPHGRRARR